MDDLYLRKLPSDYRKILPQRVRELRKYNSWSQSELSDRSKVSLGSIKRFESTGKISLDSLMRLMQVLGCLDDIDLLMKNQIENNKLKHLFRDHK